MSHGDHVAKLPDGFKITSKSIDCEIASIENYE
jgi:GMP synthase-like glutamine amidotransferase